MTAGLVDRDQAFLASIRKIADEVAAPNADGVDRDARFPSETIDALRAEGALAALVPAAMDGGGMRLESQCRTRLRPSVPLVLLEQVLCALCLHLV